MLEAPWGDGDEQWVGARGMAGCESNGCEGLGWRWSVGMEGRLMGRNAKEIQTHDADASDAVFALGGLSQHDVGFVVGHVEFGLLGFWFCHCGVRSRRC